MHNESTDKLRGLFLYFSFQCNMDLLTEKIVDLKTPKMNHSNRFTGMQIANKFSIAKINLHEISEYLVSNMLLRSMIKYFRLGIP